MGIDILLPFEHAVLANLLHSNQKLPTLLKHAEAEN